MAKPHRRSDRCIGNGEWWNSTFPVASSGTSTLGRKLRKFPTTSLYILYQVLQKRVTQSHASFPCTVPRVGVVTVGAPSFQLNLHISQLNCEPLDNKLTQTYSSRWSESPARFRPNTQEMKTEIIHTRKFEFRASSCLPLWGVFSNVWG